MNQPQMKMALTAPFPRVAIRAIVPLEGEKIRGWQVHFMDGNVAAFADFDAVIFGRTEDPNKIVTASAAALNGRLKLTD